MRILEGKNTPEPKVGIVYETEVPLGNFFQPIYCEHEATGEAESIDIGGDKAREALTMQIEPINQMSSSFTEHLSPSLSRVKKTKPLMARVNLGAWEPVTFEATIANLIANLAVEESAYKEVELKATK